VFQNDWTPFLVEVLQCAYEVSNVYNPFAIKVIKDGGHLLKKISSMCAGQSRNIFYNAPSFHEKASKLLTISDAEMAVPLTEIVQLKLQAAKVEEECNFPLVIPAEKGGSKGGSC